MNEDREDEYKKPEFIYVDEPHEEDARGGYEEQRLFMALQELHKAKYPIALRVIAFFVALFCGVVAVVVGVAALFWFVLALCGLFKVPWMNAPFEKAYKLAKKMLVLFLGSLFAVFSPPMGFGFIIMYFLMSGEAISDSILQKMKGVSDPEN